MNGVRYAGWLLVGSTIGAAVALLTAPASGQETRRRIARRIEDERDELLKKSSKALGSAADFFQEKIDYGKRKLARAVNG
jgi:gas vesicle protein